MKHELDKRAWGIIPITTYKGVIVQKISTGFVVLNQNCNTPEEVDVIIGNAQNHIKNSIKKDTTQQ
jgi:hypothetical protein